MGEGGLWRQWGVGEGLTEKAAAQINREDVNWQASRRREQSLVNERECLRQRV